MRRIDVCCTRDGASIGDIVPELGQLSALRTLSLRDNHLTGIIPTELGQLTELMHLFLNNNNLRGPVAHGT